MQVTEFAEKNKTNFVRNVRPRLQRHLPELYKGKEGNQKLLRDVRYLKISCNGKIPPVTENDRENLEELIQKGKDKVVSTTGMPPESENFLKPSQDQDRPLDDALVPFVHASVDANTQPPGSVCEPNEKPNLHDSSQNQHTHSYNMLAGISGVSYPPHPYYFPFPLQSNICSSQFPQFLHQPTFTSMPQAHVPCLQENVSNIYPLQFPQLLHQPTFTSTPQAHTTPYLQENVNVPNIYPLQFPQLPRQPTFTSTPTTTPGLQENVNVLDNQSNHTTGVHSIEPNDASVANVESDVNPTTLVEFASFALNKQ